MDTSADENKKTYNIKQIISHGRFKSKVQWEDNSITEIDNKNLNHYSIETYKEITIYNSSINTFFNKHNKKACIYLRISNRNDNTSIGYQKQNCLNYLKQNNINLQYIASDIGVSGRHMKNLNKELGCFSGYLDSNNILVLNSVDRLSRDCTKGMVFLDKMCSKNIDVVFLKENIIYNKDINSIDKQKIQNILSNAEFYSNSDSEKIKNIIKLKKQQGHYIGSVPPYGFKIKKINSIRKIEKDRNEQTNINLIIQLYKTQMSKVLLKHVIINNIVVDLNTKNIKKRNKSFTFYSIQRIIKNKIKDLQKENNTDTQINLTNFNI